MWYSVREVRTEKDGITTIIIQVIVDALYNDLYFYLIANLGKYINNKWNSYYKVFIGSE